MGAADRAACCFRINPHTYKLQVTWEGNHWGSEGVERRLGELPREKIITELRALRRASRDGTDPLMLRLARMKPTVFRKFLDRKVTRISAGTALLIPPALIDRRHHYLP